MNGWRGKRVREGRGEGGVDGKGMGVRVRDETRGVCGCRGGGGCGIFVFDCVLILVCGTFVILVF